MPRPGQARAEPKAPPFASGPGPTGDKLEGPALGASPASNSSGPRLRMGQADGLPSHWLACAPKGGIKRSSEGGLRASAATWRRSLRRRHSGRTDL